MKRFFLVTIEGRRYINTGLVELSAGVYSFDCAGLNFNQLYIDSAIGSTKTSEIVFGDSLYTYYYNNSTKSLQIRLNAADLVAKKNFIITHIVCATNNTDLYWNIDPNSPNTRKVLYKSILKKAPAFGQTQENNLNGVLSLSGSVIELGNTDQFFNNFFSVDDSFKGCELKAWRCNDIVETRRIVYKGTISKVNIDDGVIKFTSEDFLNRFDKTIYSINDSYEQSIAGGRGYSIPEGQRDYKIHRVYGRNSSFGYKYISTTSEINIKILDKDKMPKSYCVSYDAVIGTSVNRVWETGCIENLSLGLEDLYSISQVTVVGTGAGTFAKIIELTGGEYDDFSIGDTMEIASGNYCKVVDVTSNGLHVTPYTVAAAIGNSAKVSRIGALVLDKGGEEYFLHYKKDYTVNTGAGGEIINFTLVNNFEASYSIATLDPATDQIYYKLRNKSGLASYGHAAQIKKLILSEFESDEINLPSFNNAETDLDLDLCYMVPSLDGDFQNKRSLMQSLLTSSFGYLYLDDSLDICYGNFKVPSSTLPISDVEIKKDSISHSVDYDDIYQSISFTSSEFSEVFTLASNQTTHLHKTNKKKDYQHCCDVVSLVKPTSHFKKITLILTMKKLISQISTLQYSARIGDERIITSAKKLGNSECIVLSLEETDQESLVRLAQLENAKGNIELIVNGISQGNI